MFFGVLISVWLGGKSFAPEYLTIVSMLLSLPMLSFLSKEGLYSDQQGVFANARLKLVLVGIMVLVFFGWSGEWSL